jgi:hypothetical protein
MQEDGGLEGAGGSDYTPQFDILQRRLVEHMKAYSLSGREARLSDRCSGWRQAIGKRVTTSDRAVFVEDYAYNHLRGFRDNVQSKSSADQTLYNNAYGLLENPPDPDPGGVENCYPPSLAACQALLGVPLLEYYEVHLCPNGCIHWWFYMPKLVEHFNSCTRTNCPDCICPHCKSPRLIKDKKGIHGAMRCWFFFDCLHVKALDADWVTQILGTHAQRDLPASEGHASRPTFYDWPECRRILSQLPPGSTRENERFPP